MKAYHQKETNEKLQNELNKDLTFKPNLISFPFFNKYSNNNKIDNNLNSPRKGEIIDITPKKINFNKIYEKYINDKNIKDKTLEKMRISNQEKELKECTFTPKINKYIGRNINYNIYRKSENKSQEKDRNYSFRPNLNTDNDYLSKTFTNMKRPIKTKGYDKFIKRNRRVIERKKYEQKLEEDKIYGKNYDKIKKNNKLKETNISPYKKEINIKKKEKVEKECIIDNVYITMDIQLPNGIIKPLQIYNLSDSEVTDIVFEFCKHHRIKDNDRNKIQKHALQFKNKFFQNII